MKPRQHHLVPAFYLAGFTDTGLVDGFLHVFDEPRNRHYRARPRQACRQRDYYRIEELGDDPNIFETTFAKMEGLVAPVIQEIGGNGKISRKRDLGTVLSLAALIAVRDRRGRFGLSQFLSQSLRDHLLAGTISQEKWDSIRGAERRAGVDEGDLPPYEDARRRIAEGTWKPGAPRILQVALIPEIFGMLLDNLESRSWQGLMTDSRNGGFIASDSPVVFGSVEEAIRQREFSTDLKDPALEITFPVTKNFAIASYPNAWQGNGLAPDGLVAHVNTRTHVHSTGLLFHAASDFLLLRENEIRCACEYFNATDLVHARRTQRRGERDN